MVETASKERRRIEIEAKNTKMGKMSQTGWKIRQNFITKSNIALDDEERVDLFDLVKNNYLEKMKQGKTLIISGKTQYGKLLKNLGMGRKYDQSDDSDDCMVLEY